MLFNIISSSSIHFVANDRLFIYVEDWTHSLAHKHSWSLPLSYIHRSWMPFLWLSSIQLYIYIKFSLCMCYDLGLKCSPKISNAQKWGFWKRLDHRGANIYQWIYPLVSLYLSRLLGSRLGLSWRRWVNGGFLEGTTLSLMFSFFFLLP